MNVGRKLSEGVGSWLRFEQICERSELFTEKYLTHPIGQILIGCGYRVTPEYSHPILIKHMAKKGRRPAIDFVCREHHHRYDIPHGRAQTNDPNKIIVAVESKWIGNSSPSFASVLWDLIRLALIAHHEGSEAYFVLGGKKRDIERYFSNNPIRSSSNNGTEKSLLRLGKTDKEIKASQRINNKVPLEPIVPEWIPVIKRVLEKYQNLDIPISFASQLSSIFPVDATASQFQVGVWKISTLPNISVIRASKSRFYSKNDT